MHPLSRLLKIKTAVAHLRMADLLYPMEHALVQHLQVPADHLQKTARPRVPLTDARNPMLERGPSAGR